MMRVGFPRRCRAHPVGNLTQGKPWALFSVISQSSSSSSSSSFSVGRAVSQDGIALDGEGNRREVRLVLTTRTTAENDDDEKDWEMSLNRDKPWAKLSWPFGPERNLGELRHPSRSPPKRPHIELSHNTHEKRINQYRSQSLNVVFAQLCIVPIEKRPRQ